MPTYEYVCVDCANRVEVFQSFADEPLVICDTCGGRLRKVFFPVGIQLKGGGFYSSERRAAKAGAHKDGKPEKADKKAEAASDGKSDSKAGSKSDSKEAASSRSSDSSKKVPEKSA
jgi:putative FmdB family regulatory protein